MCTAAAAWSRCAKGPIRSSHDEVRSKSFAAAGAALTQALSQSPPPPPTPAGTGPSVRWPCAGLLSEHNAEWRDGAEGPQQPCTATLDGRPRPQGKARRCPRLALAEWNLVPSTVAVERRAKPSSSGSYGKRLL
ncbi:uncharacterized protein PSFLO_00584 [Pseudozyma flocculosa]|uniref:Uncharacterized protein n=1 Tax=Pseudozyma flocculosa TaxID=84751 RepID=A0A5C3ES16_9BASI|nr:uncharacterized protein PSFLO_00584 [Pseudozyma flocculosa]